MKRRIAALITVIAVMMAAVSCSGGLKSSLKGTWAIEAISGVRIVPVNEVPCIRFTPKGTYQINTGLNLISGDYVVEDGLLELKPGIMTQKAGAPEAMAIEESIVNAIQHKLEVSFNDGKACLMGKDSNSFMILAP